MSIKESRGEGVRVARIAVDVWWWQLRQKIRAIAAWKTENVCEQGVDWYVRGVGTAEKDAQRDEHDAWDQACEECEEMECEADTETAAEREMERREGMGQLWLG